MKNLDATATTKFKLNKTVVTRFTKPTAARAGGETDTSLLTITNITMLIGL